MRVFSIETSCDETAAAVVEGDGSGAARIISQTIYSQIDLHTQFGGVYPEAASREHIKKIGVVIEETLTAAAQQKSQIPNPKSQKSSNSQNPKKNISPQEYLRQEIDAIAVTHGPGLIGSLLVGVNAATSLAYALSKPIIGINHHEGHVMAAWIKTNDQVSMTNDQPPRLPALALVVSGGHTKLLWMEDFGKFQQLGATVDDAAGEAFDKVARLLGLPYPGGPEISRLAGKFQMTNNKCQITLPRPMIDSGDFNFSFSGLKTAVARLVAKQNELTDTFKEELAYAFEEAVNDVLVTKTLKAIQKYHPQSLVIAGGVAASKSLREAFTARVGQLPKPIPVHIPPRSLCTDNAAMIGAAALPRLLANQVHNWYDVKADESLAIGRN